MTARRARAPGAGGAATAAPISEAQLALLWRGQRFPQGALVTRAGVPVRVIFQGRAGRGPGPDFRGALIAGPSGIPLRGDVELHVRASSFRAHGHERDPAYANVILHVVFEDDSGGGETALPGGGSAPVVALAPWVAARAGELAHWIERPLLWREPCHGALMRMGAGGVTAALDAEGDRRIEERARRIAGVAAADGPEQALYEGLLEALGFGGNGPAMLALARHLRWDELRARGAAVDRREAFEALLLGAGGLLPSQRGQRGPVAPHVASLERAFAASGAKALAGTLWKTWGIRPENAPARRVAAAAALLAPLAAPSDLLGALSARTVNEAIAALTRATPEGYWRAHHDVCAGPCRLPPAFIGRSRALEIVVNVIAPAGIAAGGAMAARARALLAKLPRPAQYGATRFLERALAAPGERITINARRAQGLLALHRDWCAQNGCGRCPLSAGAEPWRDAEIARADERGAGVAAAAGETAGGACRRN